MSLTIDQQIVQFLRKSDGFLSGEEMSTALNISRAAVWKYIEELRREGYEINAVPHLGYKLLASPDKLFAHDIQDQLKTKILGNRILTFDTIGSTMDEAFRLGMEGIAEGAVVCAEAQAKGRGRLGRNWNSIKSKGIYMSVILRPKLPLSKMAQMTLMAAVALAEAIESASGVVPLIKWPNDLLVNDNKLAGILTELRAEVDQVKFIVLGIGLNVNHSDSQLVEGATSLKQETKHQVSRTILMQAILRSLEKWYLCLSRDGFLPVLDRWKERTATLKKRVRLTDAAGVIEGVATDLDTDGGLLIRQDTGVIIKKMAGDVLLLR